MVESVFWLHPVFVTLILGLCSAICASVSHRHGAQPSFSSMSMVCASWRRRLADNLDSDNDKDLHEAPTGVGGLRAGSVASSEAPA